MKVNASYRLTHLLLVFSLLGAFLAGCSNPPSTTAPSTLVLTSKPPATLAPVTAVPTNPPTKTAIETYWPTKAWRTSSPEDQGMDAQMLADMLEAIQAQDLSLHSLLVIRNGYIVSETYFGSSQPDTRREIYSCTKSFVATLFGIALDKGYIERTDQRVLDFFPGRTFENVDQQKEDMTLEDLLTMRSGLDWQDGDAAYRALYQSSNWVKYVLDKPMVQPPGSQFNYCSGCSHLLSVILKQSTGMNTRDFAEQHLFEPLGITNVRWDADSQGISVGGWGLKLAPREMAKLGYLYLKGGEWDGQQIVSSGWVEKATQRHTPTDVGNLGYGYQWWTYPSLEAYTALGLYGQTIFVVPDSDLIIVTTAPGLENHDKVFQLIEKYIVPAVQG